MPIAFEGGWLSSISIVIPCHNESGAVPLVMRALRDLLTNGNEPKPWTWAEVIVVNDASTDATPDLLKEFTFAKVVHLQEKSGYGAALKAGFEMANGDWIAFFDLDGTYDPSDLLPMFRLIETSSTDLIFGERFTLGRGMPAIRRFGNKIFTHLVSVLFRSHLKDVCTGYRLFSKEHKNEILQLTNRGLDFSLAMTLWALKSKKKIREVPIRYHLRSGESKLRVVPDGNRFLWTILKEHFAHQFAPRMEK